MDSFLIEVIEWNRAAKPNTRYGCITCGQSFGEITRTNDFVATFDMKLRPMICVMPLEHIRSISELTSIGAYFKFAIDSFDNSFQMIEISQGNCMHSLHLHMKLIYLDNNWNSYKKSFPENLRIILEDITDFRNKFLQDRKALHIFMFTIF